MERTTVRPFLIVCLAALTAACTMPARLYPEDGRVIPALFTWNGISGTAG
jgi:hypothetical protein